MASISGVLSPSGSPAVASARPSDGALSEGAGHSETYRSQSAKTSVAATLFPSVDDSTASSEKTKPSPSFSLPKETAAELRDAFSASKMASEQSKELLNQFCSEPAEKSRSFTVSTSPLSAVPDQSLSQSSKPIRPPFNPTPPSYPPPIPPSLSDSKITTSPSMSESSFKSTMAAIKSTPLDSPPWRPPPKVNSLEVRTAVQSSSGFSDPFLSPIVSEFPEDQVKATPTVPMYIPGAPLTPPPPVPTDIKASVTLPPTAPNVPPIPSSIVSNGDPSSQLPSIPPQNKQQLVASQADSFQGAYDLQHSDGDNAAVARGEAGDEDGLLKWDANPLRNKSKKGGDLFRLFPAY